MKKIIFIIVLFTLAKNSFAQQQILGKWLSEDGEAITEIYQQGFLFYGKISWLKNPNDKKGKPFTDTENPDPNKRTQDLLDLVILNDFFFKNNKWENGTIYDPNNGKTYNCSMWIDNGNLKVRGYLGIFYQTQTWTKTK